MNDLVYLFAGFAIAWGGILVYVIRLGSMKRALEIRLKELEKRVCQSVGESI